MFWVFSIILLAVGVAHVASPGAGWLVAGGLTTVTAWRLLMAKEVQP